MIEPLCAIEMSDSEKDFHEKIVRDLVRDAGLERWQAQMFSWASWNWARMVRDGLTEQEASK